jgi:hypothetical protein
MLREALRLTRYWQNAALAEGQLVFNCSTTEQQWEVHASVQGRELFQEGAAIAVAMSRKTTDRGETDDAHQW